MASLSKVGGWQPVRSSAESSDWKVHGYGVGDRAKAKITIPADTLLYKMQKGRYYNPKTHQVLEKPPGVSAPPDAKVGRLAGSISEVVFTLQDDQETLIKDVMAMGSIPSDWRAEVASRIVASDMLVRHYQSGGKLAAQGLKKAIANLPDTKENDRQLGQMQKKKTTNALLSLSCGNIPTPPVSVQTANNRKKDLVRSLQDGDVLFGFDGTDVISALSTNMTLVQSKGPLSGLDWKNVQGYTGSGADKNRTALADFSLVLSTFSSGVCLSAERDSITANNVATLLTGSLAAKGTRFLDEDLTNDYHLACAMLVVLASSGGGEGASHVLTWNGLVHGAAPSKFLKDSHAGALDFLSLGAKVPAKVDEEDIASEIDQINANLQTLGSDLGGYSASLFKNTKVAYDKKTGKVQVTVEAKDGKSLSESAEATSVASIRIRSNPKFPLVNFNSNLATYKRYPVAHKYTRPVDGAALDVLGALVYTNLVLVHDAVEDTIQLVTLDWMAELVPDEDNSEARDISAETQLAILASLAKRLPESSSHHYVTADMVHRPLSFSQLLAYIWQVNNQKYGSKEATRIVLEFYLAQVKQQQQNSI